MTLLSRSNVLRGILLVFLISVTASMAGAGLTPWYDLPGSEASVTEILAHYYTTWQRVEDFPPPGDQYWYETDGVAYAQAKYASYTLEFGYDAGQDVTTPTTWNLVTGSGYDATFGNVTIIGDPFFTLFLKVQTSTVYSSVEAYNYYNYSTFDHMITYKILTDDVGDEPEDDSSGNYVVFWEDMASPGWDQDYNDLVVEMSDTAPIPEPGTLVLLGLGLLSAGFVAIRRRR